MFVGANSNDIIGVYYFRPNGVVGTTTGALHAGVFYSTVGFDGQRVTVTFDAGPTVKNPPVLDVVRELAAEAIGIRDPATPYGTIVNNKDVIFGSHWQNGEVPLPDGVVGQQVLATGVDLGTQFASIDATFNSASNGNYYYFPTLQNSNTVAAAALTAAGITWLPPTNPFSNPILNPVPPGLGEGGPPH